MILSFLASKYYYEIREKKRTALFRAIIACHGLATRTCYAIIVIIIVIAVIISVIATRISVYHDNAAILQLNCRNDTLCCNNSISHSRSIGKTLLLYLFRAINATETEEASGQSIDVVHAIASS